MKEREERAWRWAIVALLAGALVLGYMFALNGRYVYERNEPHNACLIDKWTHQAIMIKPAEP